MYDLPPSSACALVTASIVVLTSNKNESEVDIAKVHVHKGAFGEKGNFYFIGEAKKDPSVGMVTSKKSIYHVAIYSFHYLDS